MTDEDGLRAAELEEEFAELGGWEAESDASRLLQGLGIAPEKHQTVMSDMDPRLKFKVLLAQALFGSPDIILLDEPTNNLDLASVVWLENFLLDYEGTVLVVSHDRYFPQQHLHPHRGHRLRQDQDTWAIRLRDEFSQLIQRLTKDQNKKAEQKIEELQTFIRRFSANKSESRRPPPAGSCWISSRWRSCRPPPAAIPGVGFRANREPGKDRLFVTDLCKTVDGVPLLKNVSFIVGRDDKIALLGKMSWP